MQLRNKLQIILITYNREKYLQRMLTTLLASTAPTHNLNILVIDNNSTDYTSQIVKKFQKEHPNVSYHKNPHNIGLGANIARALDMANQEYMWLLGDDDIVHFEAWSYVEEAVAKGKEIICVADYAIPANSKQDLAFLTLQMSFISACIFKTALFTDTIMTNVMNNIYTLFPHLAPIVEYINNGRGKEIYLLPSPLASNGMETGIDTSYIRGYDKISLYLKQRSMSWIVGYANILIQLQNKSLLHHMMEVPIQGPIHTGWGEFYQFMQDRYALRGNWIPILETLRAIDPIHHALWWIYLLSPLKFYCREKGLYLCLFWFIKTRIWRTKLKYN